MRHTYHVITPMVRIENLPALAAMLEPHKVIWHVLTDEGSPPADPQGHAWIHPLVVPNTEVKFYERCNHAINWFLENTPLVDADRYCILNDDDAYEPGFFEKIDKHAGDVIIASMERGDRTPSNVGVDRAHSTSKHWAKPENMKPGHVGVEQAIISGRIIKAVRIPLDIVGDGMMIEQLVKAHAATYSPEANVWFNYYEPGRWDHNQAVLRPTYDRPPVAQPPIRDRAREAFRAHGVVGLIGGAMRESRVRGIRGILGGAMREARARANAGRDSAELLHHKLLGPRTFTFDGATYRYFNHKYNMTWRNERTVEVPIAVQAVEAAKGKRVLEVGNVLAHYHPFEHDVVDKYETAHGVHNADVVEYLPSKRYDLIVTVSTLEHVGFDETPRDPTKTLRAVEHLATLLAPGGRLLVTVPLGYNPYMDAMLRERKFPFTKMRLLKRVSADNRWKEVSWDEAKDAKYGAPFPFANAILVGIIENKEGSS